MLFVFFHFFLSALQSFVKKPHQLKYESLQGLLPSWFCRPTMSQQYSEEKE
jgi:hypothetical protein